jgi:hypothetical protein
MQVSLCFSEIPNNNVDMLSLLISNESHSHIEVYIEEQNLQNWAWRLFIPGSVPTHVASSSWLLKLYMLWVDCSWRLRQGPCMFDLLFDGDGQFLRNVRELVSD